MATRTKRQSSRTKLPLTRGGLRRMARGGWSVVIMTKDEPVVVTSAERPKPQRKGMVLGLLEGKMMVPDNLEESGLSVEELAHWNGE